MNSTFETPTANKISKSNQSGNRRLTQAEIDFYNAQGYLIVENLFSPEELENINKEIERLRDEAEKNVNQKEGFSHNKHFIYQLGLRSPLTRGLCEDPRILDLIESIVYPGIAIYSAKTSEKPPFDTNICHWHQDDAWYNSNSQSERRMSIWIPLQDTDLKNGCLWVVPGSHLTGFREFSKIEGGLCNLAFEKGDVDLPGMIPVPIKAGSILLFDSLTYHRSLPNYTDKWRRSFICSYQEATVGKGNANQHKILRPAA